MKILAFESSCDETAAAVVEDGRKILSDAIASQAEMHALYGGVVPEIASRKHVEVIAALTERALAEANCTKDDIDAVAVTYAPGLIGAVLVGLSFAKSLAYGWGVPLITVQHVRGHIAANYLAFPDLEPPWPWPSPAATPSSRMSGTTPTSASWAPPGMTQRGSASIRPPGSWACPIPAASPWTSWRSSPGAGSIPCPTPGSRGRSWT